MSVLNLVLSIFSFNLKLKKKKEEEEEEVVSRRVLWETVRKN